MQNPFLYQVQGEAQLVDQTVSEFLRIHEEIKKLPMSPAWEHAASFELNIGVYDVVTFAYLVSLCAVNDNYELFDRTILQRVDYKIPGARLSFICKTDRVSTEINEYFERKDEYGTVENLLKQACMEVTGEIPF